LIFPTAPGFYKKEKRSVLKLMQKTYTNDAYHSLSIEGYQISKEMIEKVLLGAWNPDHPAIAKN